MAPLFRTSRPEAVSMMTLPVDLVHVNFIHNIGTYHTSTEELGYKQRYITIPRNCSYEELNIHLKRTAASAFFGPQTTAQDIVGWITLYFGTHNLPLTRWNWPFFSGPPDGLEVGIGFEFEAYVARAVRTELWGLGKVFANVKNGTSKGTKRESRTNETWV